MSRWIPWSWWRRYSSRRRWSAAQGVLVVVDPSQQVRLPRPIIIWPPHPPHPPLPPPRPVPADPRPATRSRSSTSHARLVDQVAQVQVSQTFVNTGSRQMEVCVRLSAAVRRRDRPADADGRRQGVSRPSCCRPTKPGGIYEEHRPQEPATRPCWNGSGTGMFKTSVFPVPPGAERTVTLRYSQLCRKHATG